MGVNTAHWQALCDPEPQLRADAAVKLGEAWLANAQDLPSTPSVFAEIARHDAEHPGIADAFFVTIHYDFRDSDDFVRADVSAWILKVLHARRERRAPLSPVPGNDLEFHAHDRFDSDPAALRALLDWGYVSVVSLALDHRGALPREQYIPLAQAMFVEHGEQAWGLALAARYGVLIPSALSELPTLRLGTGRAHLLSRAYGYETLWHVHWLFPQAPAQALSLGKRRDLLEELSRAGVPLVPQRATLERSSIRYIPFPEVPGAKRRKLYPRADIAIDLLLLPGREVSLLRVVQANR